MNSEEKNKQEFDKTIENLKEQLADKVDFQEMDENDIYDLMDEEDNSLDHLYYQDLEETKRLQNESEKMYESTDWQATCFEHGYEGGASTDDTDLSGCSRSYAEFEMSTGFYDYVDDDYIPTEFDFEDVNEFQYEENQIMNLESSDDGSIETYEEEINNQSIDNAFADEEKYYEMLIEENNEKEEAENIHLNKIYKSISK